MEDTMAVKDVISLVVASAALVVSIIVAVRMRRYNRISLRATHRSNYMSALLNLNREMVGHPELWAVYDQNWQPYGYDSPIEIARRRAFIWYHLNLFELFYTDYHLQRQDSPDPSAHEHWKAWDTFIRSFLKGSVEAQAIVKDKSAMALLHREFRNYLNGCLPKANRSD